MSKELHEGREIVAELLTNFDKLKPADQRYTLTWSRYLMRTGDGAEVGERRLKWLRDLYAAHCGKDVAVEEEAA